MHIRWCNFLIKTLKELLIRSQGEYKPPDHGLQSAHGLPALIRCHIPLTHSAAATLACLLSPKRIKANPASWPDTCFFLCLEHSFLWSPHGSSFTSSGSLLKYHLREISLAHSPFKTTSPPHLQLISNFTCCFTFLYGISTAWKHLAFFKAVHCLPPLLEWQLSEDSDFACLVQTKRPVSPTSLMVTDIQ